MAIFIYNEKQRLASSSERLGHELRQLGGPSMVIGHSMGALLLAYLGSTDVAGEFSELRSLYINPLIGGSRYADRLLALWWLHPLKGAIQRVFFPASVQDLAPESEFQQRIFGPRRRVSSFRAHTKLVFTEVPGGAPDIEPTRLEKFFNRTRDEIISTTGDVVDMQLPIGHSAPLDAPEFIAPLLEELLNDCARVEL